MFPGGIHAYPYGVQTCFALVLYTASGLDPFVLILILPLVCMFSYFDDGFANGLPHQQWLAFAALTETDNRKRSRLQVGNGEFDDFFRPLDEK